MEIEKRNRISSRLSTAQSLIQPGPRAPEIVFDRFDPGPTIAFYPERLPSEATEQWLWWRLSPTPEVIDEVIEMLNEGRAQAEAIAIGGLERYPVPLGEWPRWLARWSLQSAPSTIAVDTAGLTRRQRRRMMGRTRRQLGLTSARDPITRAIDKFNCWITGRSR